MVGRSALCAKGRSLAGIQAAAQIRCGPAACGTGWRRPPVSSAARARPVFGASGAAGLQAGENLRTLARACGPSAYGRRDGENSVTLTAASGDRSAAVATSLPTWCVASQIRGLAWRAEQARLEPARRAGPARLPGCARAPRGPGTRRHRHTRQSLRARQPPPGDEQAREPTRPCRSPKRAQRGGHLHPPWRPRGPPVLP
jgi:hypothetical protein